MNFYAMFGGHKPVSLVEGYESLIWTERYRPCGDFEMKTPFIEETINLLPLGSFVCIEESEEIQIVETHSIDIDDKGETSLTVQGRTLESFFEERVAYKEKDTAASANPWVVSSRTSADAIVYICNAWTMSVAPNTSDRLSNVAILNLVTKPMTSLTRSIEIGYLYDRVFELLSEDDNGIRTIRPGNIGSATTNFEIYDGVDRTETVIFSDTQGHFQKQKYLFSIKDYKTSAYVHVTNNLGEAVNLPFARWDRRVGYVSASDLTLSFSDPTEAEQVVPRGVAYLVDHQKTSLFDGNISANIPYQLGVDYNLGDIITIVGKYDFNSPMRVAEYVRVEDKDGDRGYPTFSELPRTDFSS